MSARERSGANDSDIEMKAMAKQIKKKLEEVETSVFKVWVNSMNVDREALFKWFKDKHEYEANELATIELFLKPALTDNLEQGVLLNLKGIDYLLSPMFAMVYEWNTTAKQRAYSDTMEYLIALGHFRKLLKESKSLFDALQYFGEHFFSTYIYDGCEIVNLSNLQRREIRGLHATLLTKSWYNVALEQSINININNYKGAKASGTFKKKLTNGMQHELDRKLDQMKREHRADVAELEAKIDVLEQQVRRKNRSTKYSPRAKKYTPSNPGGADEVIWT